MGRNEHTRTWLATGTSSGIGLEAVRQLLARGYRVAATTRDQARLADLAAEYDRDRLWTAELDLTNAAQIAAVVDEAFEHFGRIDVVLSNAGYGLFGAAEEVSDEQIDRQLQTNLLAPIRLLRAAVPHLRAQGGGRWIQVSSSGGEVPDPAMSLYNAGKYGVEGFFGSVAIELAPLGIDVILAVPSATRTNFFASMDWGAPLDAYRDTPVGRLRAALQGEAGAGHIDSGPMGDPARIAAALIDVAQQSSPPSRLILTARAYEAIEAGLQQRLSELRAQQGVAYAVDTSTTS